MSTFPPALEQLPRPAVPFDGCRWCGASFTQKGLAPPRRDCCDEQRREQHGRDTFSAGLREIVLPLALSNLKREASTAEAITRARHVYAGGPRPSP